MNMSLKFLLPALESKLKTIRAVCALRTCHNRMLMRAVPQGRAGIRLGEEWYCGVDCFSIAARTPLAALTNGRVMEMPRAPRLSIGLVMISKGYLTDEQLRYAIDQSQSRGEALENALIRLGLAGERQLAAARAAQWGYPVLGHDYVGQPVETDVPVALLRACEAVPLHTSLKARRVLLGFVYRVEHSLLQSMEQVTGLRAEPCFITPTEFQEQMARVAAAPDYGEVIVEEGGTPVQMSRTVSGYAVEVAARQVTLARCRNHVWARLSGKKRTLDLVFPPKSALETARKQNSTRAGETCSSLA
jgi:hypothetical protein